MRAAASSPVTAPHCSAEIWAIRQPGSLQIQHVYAAMDPSQAHRPAHSHLSSLSIPIGKGKTPSTPAATSSPVTAPHCPAEVWVLSGGVGPTKCYNKLWNAQSMWSMWSTELALTEVTAWWSSSTITRAGILTYARLALRRKGSWAILLPTVMSVSWWAVIVANYIVLTSSPAS